MFAPDVPGILRAAAKRFPGREAAVSGRDRVTYAALHQRAGRVAVELLLAVLEEPDPSSISTRGELPVELMVRSSTGVATNQARP